jgi:hypothetical protein
LFGLSAFVVVAAYGEADFPEAVLVLALPPGFVVATDLLVSMAHLVWQYA